MPHRNILCSGIAYGILVHMKEVNEMETKTEVSTNDVQNRVIGAYSMNDIMRRIGNDTVTDADRRAIVDLWCTAHAMKRELDTLKRLIWALPVDQNLPY